jgi:ATP-dependent helicase HrpB
MSATIDPGPVAEALGGCPVIEVPGRPHEVEVEHAPTLSAVAALRRELARPGGDLLCFLPGAADIRRAAEELRVDAERAGAALLPLHGSLPPAEQEEALRPRPERKVVLATNVAETSLTVEGVSVVVDSGREKVLRHDPSRGLDRLEPARISLDSARQRAGRAGRTGPGRCVRLWDERLRLEPHREPEIRRVDLSGPFLDVLAWGADPRRFEWHEAPPTEAAEAAWQLLRRLRAVDAAGRLSPRGEALRRLPLHPRLGTVLLEAGGSPRAAAACAILSARDAVRDELPSGPCDVAAGVDRLSDMPAGVRRAAQELERRAAAVLGGTGPDDDELLRRALLAGWPDRVARRREPGSPRLLLSSGAGAVLARESGVRDAEWLVAVEVQAGRRRERAEALVRVATAVERAWLEPDAIERATLLEGERVRGLERERLGALVLRERPVEPDPAEAARLIAEEVLRRGLDPENEQLLRRLRFAGLEAELEPALASACAGRLAVPRLRLVDALSPSTRRELAQAAPERLAVPSGRSVPLVYREDGRVVLSVKLQELFGLADTPRVGRARLPVLVELLAPNGRPVQTTEDLRSFWERGYPEVRKELRGRYPKHPWPEDPWTAEPTRRTKRGPR